MYVNVTDVLIHIRILLKHTVHIARYLYRHYLQTRCIHTRTHTCTHTHTHTHVHTRTHARTHMHQPYTEAVCDNYIVGVARFKLAKLHITIIGIRSVYSLQIHCSLRTLLAIAGNTNLYIRPLSTATPTSMNTHIVQQHQLAHNPCVSIVQY